MLLYLLSCVIKLCLCFRFPDKTFRCFAIAALTLPKQLYAYLSVVLFYGGETSTVKPDRAGANLIRSRPSIRIRSLDGSDQHLEMRRGKPYPISRWVGSTSPAPDLYPSPSVGPDIEGGKSNPIPPPKPLRLWVAPSTVTGGYLSTSSSFDSVKEKQSSRTHSHLQLHIS
ncbi:hypothetical protein BHM03_00046008 [Ensete ventricosum]|nr:hypothetical protein BHM03_00046008 [Ensete ventricosum]